MYCFRLWKTNQKSYFKKLKKQRLVLYKYIILFIWNTCFTFSCYKCKRIPHLNHIRLNTVLNRVLLN